MAKVILGSVFKQNKNTNPELLTAIPCMKCEPRVGEPEHNENFPADSILYNAFVARLLTNKEILASSEAIAAIQEEAKGLRELGAWDETSERMA